MCVYLNACVENYAHVYTRTIHTYMHIFARVNEWQYVLRPNTYYQGRLVLTLEQERVHGTASTRQHVAPFVAWPAVNENHPGLACEQNLGYGKGLMPSTQVMTQGACVGFRVSGRADGAERALEGCLAWRRHLQRAMSTCRSLCAVLHRMISVCTFRGKLSG
jgi:hypothetical protein